RSYDIGKLKERLQPAIGELERADFLVPLGRHERYVRTRRGTWRILLLRKAPEGGRRLTAAGFRALERALIARGVTAATATELAAAHPAERVAAKLEVLDWL